MTFKILNKVALVTGGASGLGFHIARDLLKNGLKGVTLADVSEQLAEKALGDIHKEFGENRAIFVKTDVTNIGQFENAFQKTVEKFNNVDILINNAGIMNDAIWEKEISININGTVHGMLLGFDKYIPKYKSGPDGLVVNLSSVAGVGPFPGLPVYCGTKFAVGGMTLSWGQPEHYERTKVRVVALCPGKTETALLDDLTDKVLDKSYFPILGSSIKLDPIQTAEQLSSSMMQIIQNAKNGTIWIAEGGQPPYQFELRDRNAAT